MNLFGRAKAAKTTPKDAILNLRASLEMLEKREKNLQAKIDNENRIARANVTKNRRLALEALKRKRAFESFLDKTMGARMTLEQQAMAIENANVNLETMNAMRAGAEAMKSIHGALDINKVDNIMDDIRDQMDLANEISDAISQPVNNSAAFDEDELNAELETLEQEELDARLLEHDLPSMADAPAVPDKAIPAVAQPPRPGRAQQAKPAQLDDDEDAELADLKASMAM